jgi:hypothetical protein
MSAIIFGEGKLKIRGYADSCVLEFGRLMPRKTLTWPAKLMYSILRENADG